MRCSILACFSLATLLFVNPVLAQAPEANAEQLKALEKKVRELEQQIANQLKTQLGPGAIPGAGAANPFGGPPTSAFGTPSNTQRTLQESIRAADQSSQGTHRTTCEGTRRGQR